MPRTDVVHYHQDDPRGGRRVMVAWPEEPPPPAGYPVIYLLDGNATFGTLVEAIRMRAHRPAATGVVPAVVVGVGSERDGPYDRVRRTFDYTPPTAAGAATGLETGGREAFERVLLGELAERIESRYPIDRSRRILLGHSLGGFFVLDLLLRRPDAYAAFIAISPSIWWDSARLFEAAQGLGAVLGGAKPRIMISVGEYEQALAPWQARS
ncbi:MAG: alpha/beta hydrolase, partial [Gemmatimonadales bacterium]